MTLKNCGILVLRLWQETPCESSFERYLRCVRDFWPTVDTPLKCILNAICGVRAASGHVTEPFEMQFERYLRYVRSFWICQRDLRNAV